MGNYDIGKTSGSITTTHTFTESYPTEKEINSGDSSHTPRNKYGDIWG